MLGAWRGITRATRMTFLCQATALSSRSPARVTWSSAAPRSSRRSSVQEEALLASCRCSHSAWECWRYRWKSSMMPLSTWKSSMLMLSTLLTTWMRRHFQLCGTRMRVAAARTRRRFAAVRKFDVGFDTSLNDSNSTRMSVAAVTMRRSTRKSSPRSSLGQRRQQKQGRQALCAAKRGAKLNPASKFQTGHQIERPSSRAVMNSGNKDPAVG
mmetsp:Transcript_76920/g.138780  ORF Transcript_76920/g.138780 Transcript_76920/m.138780 type:complete len:212 (+) Transcript_76920:482-1117(+)